MLLQTALLLGSSLPSAWLLGFVGAATVFGYQLEGRPALRGPAWALGVCAAVCFFYLPPGRQLSVVLPAVVWLLYYDRYRPGLGTGLRRFPLLKPLAIALAWAGVTVLLPLPPEHWPPAALLFLGRSAFIFALALAYDLCDQPDDQRAGLDTLVLRLGPTRSRRLIYAAFGAAAACALAQFGLRIYTCQATLALLVSLALSAVLIRPFTEQLAWGGWRKTWIDSLMFVQFVFVWLIGR